jgi:phage baseplate assembly protein W
MAVSQYRKVAVTSTRLPTQATVSKTYRGLSTINQNAVNFALYDIELIKQDILNHFYIRQGEKLENPTFGTIIWDLLYEPLTDTLKDAIAKNVTTIINYDPRVTAEKVIVSEFDSGIQVECVMTYLPYNISEQMQMSFDQANTILK